MVDTTSSEGGGEIGGAPRLPEPIRWTADGGGLLILDQTRLPAERVERELRSLEEVEEAIRSLRVRGAPLIGITAAMGVAALARREAARARRSAERAGASEAEPAPGMDAGALLERLEGWCDRLVSARPTAVNLAGALRRLRAAARAAAGEVGPGADGAVRLAECLAQEADAIRAEDRRMCRRIGEHAVDLLRDGGAVVTHCNAGALATGGMGTALAPIYVAHERGWRLRVFADETRPLLQGSRLTAWELGQAGVEVTVIADGTAGALMAGQRPDAVLVGADRIAANGDVANKIGTYGLAVLARHHDVPFYVLAPTTTVDLDTPTGAEIPIEHRDPDEVRRGFGPLTAPEEAAVWTPAFDVTPGALVDAIITERGLCRPPYGASLAEAVRGAETERAAGSAAESGAGPPTDGR